MPKTNRCAAEIPQRPNGGQRLFILPTLDFVLVVTAGNYDTEDQWRPPIALLREVFLPSLTD